MAEGRHGSVDNNSEVVSGRQLGDSILLGQVVFDSKAQKLKRLHFSQNTDIKWGIFLMILMERKSKNMGLYCTKINVTDR